MIAWRSAAEVRIGTSSGRDPASACSADAFDRLLPCSAPLRRERGRRIFPAQPTPRLPIVTPAGFLQRFLAAGAELFHPPAHGPEVFAWKGAKPRSVAILCERIMS